MPPEKHHELPPYASPAWQGVPAARRVEDYFQCPGFAHHERHDGGAERDSLQRGVRRNGEFAPGLLVRECHGAGEDAGAALGYGSHQAGVPVHRCNVALRDPFDAL